METKLYDQESLREFLEEADLIHYFELFRDILKVGKLSQLRYVAIEDLVQIGLSKPEQTRYKKVYSKHYPNSYISRLKKLLHGNKKNVTIRGRGGRPVAAMAESREKAAEAPTNDHIIKVDDVHVVDTLLRHGHFGTMYKGVLLNDLKQGFMAIKSIRKSTMNVSVEDFIKEIGVIKQIVHQNIIKLYGVVERVHDVMIITEFSTNGSLVINLRDLFVRHKFPVTKLINYCQQICDAMAFMHTKGVVHGALECRNIFLFDRLYTFDTVKVADIGLYKAVGAGVEYIQKKINDNIRLPVCWCAAECLQTHRFTMSSDVYSFGITMYEIFTYGRLPYETEHDDFNLIPVAEWKKALWKPAPNERPTNCPEEYFQLIQECWSCEEHRPNSADLVLALRTMKPMQMKALVGSSCRKQGMLNYAAGDIIIVLGKEKVTSTSMWFGVGPTGAVGAFDHTLTEYLSGGFDNLHIAGTSYRPSEELEQVPLLNPNSPSHTTGATCTSPYPLLSPAKEHIQVTEDLSQEEEIKSKSLKITHKTFSEPTTTKGILNKVKSATLGRAHKHDHSAAKQYEDHVYEEISDVRSDEESTSTVNSRVEAGPESISTCSYVSEIDLGETHKTLKSDTRRKTSKNQRYEAEAVASTSRLNTLIKGDKKKSHDTGSMKLMSSHDKKTLETAVALANEITTRSMNDLVMEPKTIEKVKVNKIFPRMPLRHHPTNTEAEKTSTAGKQEKRNFSDEANNVPGIQETLTEDSKRAYASLIEHPTPSTSMMTHTQEPSTGLAKYTQIQPAPRAQDQQKTDSAHKQIVRKPRLPTPPDTPPESTKMLNALPLPHKSSEVKLVEKQRHVRKHPLRVPAAHIPAADVPSAQVPAAHVPSAHVPAAHVPSAHVPATHVPSAHVPVAQEPTAHVPSTHVPSTHVPSTHVPSTHVPSTHVPTVHVPEHEEQIYQNTPVPDEPEASGEASSGDRRYEHNPINPDHPVPLKPDPAMTCYLGRRDITDEDCKIFEEVSLRRAKDHVSVEDLLEFADHKPSSKQRGIDSDEVRVMCRVMKNEISPQLCLEALNLNNWNIYAAIKFLRVKLAVAETEHSDEEIRQELVNSEGDSAKAVAALIHKKRDKK